MALTIATRTRRVMGVGLFEEPIMRGGLVLRGDP